MFRISFMSSRRYVHLRYRSLVFLLRCMMTHGTTIPCTMHAFHLILAHALNQFMSEINLRVGKPIQILCELSVHRI